MLAQQLHTSVETSMDSVSVYVGDLDRKTTSQVIESELQVYGEILSVKIPRPSSVLRYAFVEFKHLRDAQLAIQSWNSKFSWRLELSIDKKKKGAKHSQKGTIKKNRVASTSIWKPVPPPPPQWDELPEDITAKILHKLGPFELLASVQAVCTSWRKICRDPAMWRVIDMYKLDDVRGKLHFSSIRALCRLAVYLSQGKVTEINIKHFADSDLLKYILERGGHLRCLRFAFCDDLSFKTLSQSKGFPVLEELHIDFHHIYKEGIEAIGRSCPMLKTFALNNGYTIYNSYTRYNTYRRCNEEALAVATFMPELRHLQLVGNHMTEDALEAILTGCPKLESLDLRLCADLNLEGELGKRCAQQIKTLRRPCDPIEDYERYNDLEEYYEHERDHFVFWDDYKNIYVDWP